MAKLTGNKEGQQTFAIPALQIKQQTFAIPALQIKQIQWKQLVNTSK
jgi:hypothetical protein